MRISSPLVFAVFYITFFLVPEISAGQSEVASIIRTTLESGTFEQEIKVGGTPLFSSVVIHRFYQDRGFEAAWSSEGVLPEIAYEMRYEIQQARFDGLNPMDYHLALIESYFNKYEDSRKGGDQFNLNEVDLAFLDMLLTDAYIMLSSHIYLGKVNPENLKSQWNIQRSAPELRIDLRLKEALQHGSLRKSLEGLYPSFLIYKKMRDTLRELVEIESEFEHNPVAEWKRIRVDKSIKPTESNNNIPEIRKRLLFWGLLEDYHSEDLKIYDSIMEAGIKKLQVRHGLDPDGVIGQGTVHALGQTPRDLIETVSVNLERLRWLPDSLKDQELILVNTANFQLDYILKRDTLLSSRVIVGKSYHSTPQFSALMSYIVFSPTWTVPNSIIRNEIIPAIRKDPQYLTKKNMQVLTSSGTAVDPNTIDWAKVNPRNFPYMIRQGPGEQNSLGLVKFMFPNKYSVYIHDTPSRSLFSREDRALSHGCIRIQKPAELAKLLLAFDPGWTDQTIHLAMRQSRERTVLLDRKIPVVVLYLTFWTDTLGRPYFRRDIYDRDAEIYKALREGRKGKSGI